MSKDALFRGVALQHERKLAVDVSSFLFVVSVLISTAYGSSLLGAWQNSIFYNDRHGACMAIANKCIGAIGAIGLSADSKRHAAAKLKFLTTFAQ